MSARALSRLIISAAVIAPETDIKCCRRSELPLYVQPAKCEEAKDKIGNTSEKTSIIENAIRSIRLNVDSVVKEVRKYEDLAKNTVKDGVDNAQWLLDYLGDEENQAPKAPAIAIGGLTGFIFGLRGGIIKKVIYTSVGALGMAAVCYPKEAKEYGGLVAEEGVKYATIAYNFAYGVKKGDPPIELPSLPKLPGSLSEAVTMISDFASSTSASLTDKHAPADTLGSTPILEEKEVREEDPCKWVERHKRSVSGSGGRSYPETSATADRDDTCDENETIYSGNFDDPENCPCHLGSCMHPTSKEDCPDELPYPPPNCPDPPPAKCLCGKCTPESDSDE